MGECVVAYENLFSPIRIGTMELPNRVVMSPMTTDYGTRDQEPSERLMAYLEARAKGGVGLITLEVCSVALDHRYQPNSLSLSEDRFIPLHRKLVEMVHSHGVKIQPQITHPGPESLAPFFEKKPGIGPSVCVNPSAMQSSRPLELDEIPAVIEQYAAAAVRAKESGYDGIELHAAHAYMLLGSFLSPLRNGRRDEYGGKSLRVRARLLLETLTAVRAAVGPEFPITVSLSGYERFPGGRAVNESQRLAQMLVEAGADAFRVSGGTTDRLVTSMIMSSDFPDDINVTQAEAIRQVVDVPVIVVGRIHTPEHAERIIAAGRADLVGMGRPFLADPEWPNKARADRSDQIRRCISCENCIDSMIEYQNLSCAVNAATGRELSNVLTPAIKRKRVVVIGGGPAGMETARVANLRGHDVTLLERQGRLGGSMLLASTVHSDNEHFFKWLTKQVRESTVDVRLRQEASPELVASLQPDAIVVATGARVATPAIPGTEQHNVFSGAQLRRMVEGQATPDDFALLPAPLRGVATWFMQRISAYLKPALLRNFTRLWLPLGRRVVIVGADLAAIELAEFLTQRGRTVHVLEAGKRIAPEIGPKRLTEHMDRLDRMGVTINTEVQCESIAGQKVQYRTALGVRRTLQADSIILAGEPVAATEWYERMKDLAPEVHAIGDCTGLGLIRKATDEAMQVACAL
jgi:2,4-dienoyl-CoA reductase-like NADH-dependent reductase (Old Yellow Enzyme family)/thioredoxin reductase